MLLSNLVEVEIVLEKTFKFIFLSKLALFCILVYFPKINKTHYDSAKLVKYFIPFINVDPLAIFQLI